MADLLSCLEEVPTESLALVQEHTKYVCKASDIVSNRDMSTEHLGVGLLGMNFRSQHSSLRIRPRWLGYIQHCLGSAASNNDLGMAWVYSAEIVEYHHYIFDESEWQL